MTTPKATITYETIRVTGTPGFPRYYSHGGDPNLERALKIFQSDPIDEEYLALNARRYCDYAGRGFFYRLLVPVVRDEQKRIVNTFWTDPDNWCMAYAVTGGEYTVNADGSVDVRMYNAA